MVSSPPSWRTAIQLLVSGSSNDSDTVHLCELNGKSRDTTRAKYQNRIAGLQFRRADKCIPRGDCRTRKRGCFLVGEVFGHPDQSLLVEDTAFLRHPSSCLREEQCSPFPLDRSFAPALAGKNGLTRSPIFHRVTPTPNAMTSPAPSESGTAGRSAHGIILTLGKC